jgi:hypothetical protein
MIGHCKSKEVSEMNKDIEVLHLPQMFGETSSNEDYKEFLISKGVSVEAAVILATSAPDDILEQIENVQKERNKEGMKTNDALPVPELPYHSFDEVKKFFVEKFGPEVAEIMMTHAPKDRASAIALALRNITVNKVDDSEVLHLPTMDFERR